jgi:ectoine hydroxylase-related dioxygenase (phytanoyl-CoA dioxygenase family)
VIITDSERASCQFEDGRFAQCISELEDTGFVILENGIDRRIVSEVAREYSTLVDRLSSVDGHDRHQRSHSGEKHYQIQPEIRGVFADVNLFANPLVLACIRAVLGSDTRLAYYNSNYCEPGSSFQEIHRDTRLLFDSEMDLPTPPFLMVVNILLCDFTSVNGSTEVWPGSHLLCDKLHEEYPHDFDSRANVLHSKRVNAEAGSIIIRDARLWHRGTPNESATVRAMLSLVYKRRWHALRLDHSLAVAPEIFDTWPADVRALFCR